MATILVFFFLNFVTLKSNRLFNKPEFHRRRHHGEDGSRPEKPLFCIREIEYTGSKATGNSRFESQKFPPLSVEILENSRYANTAYTPRV